MENLESTSLQVSAAMILVVDDKEENLFVMEAVLKSIPGCEVVKANSGEEAIARVKESEFALILLDIQMPKLDGYETARLIKQLPNGKDAPIMMVSAIYTEDPFILKGYLAGAVDYIPKPFSPEILKAKVGVYLNLYKRFRPAAIPVRPDSAYPNDRRHGERRQS